MKKLIIVALSLVSFSTFAEAPIVEIILSQSVSGEMVMAQGELTQYFSEDFVAENGIHGRIECTNGELGGVGTAKITYSFRSHPHEYIAEFKEYCWPLRNILKDTSSNLKTKFTINLGTENVEKKYNIQE
jgi:hypothetical protein